MLRILCVRPFPYECSPMSGACAFSCRDAASISEVDAVPLFTSSACNHVPSIKSSAVLGVGLLTA